MTRIADGPAKGQSFTLQRSPVFLRLVLKQQKWDALDLLDDEPATDEVPFAYRITGNPGSAFVDGRDPKTGKRFGYRCAVAEYAFCNDQPSEATMRNNELWAAWCKATYEATPEP